MVKKRGKVRKNKRNQVKKQREEESEGEKVSELRGFQLFFFFWSCWLKSVTRQSLSRLH